MLTKIVCGPLRSLHVTRLDLLWQYQKEVDKKNIRQIPFTQLTVRRASEFGAGERASQQTMASIIPCQSTSAAAVFRRGAAHHCAFPTCRTLSSSARHNAALTNQAQLKGKSQPQMSMNSRMKELLKSANRDLIPEDMGLLPGTFIRPVWQNMPSLFKEPQLRLHMEWLYWKMKVQNFLGLVIGNSS